MELIHAQLTEVDIAWILEIRRERSRVFGDDLFSDPAWDILLELFAARLAERRMTLGDLASVAPQSTLARWVAALEERGLVELMVDPLEPDQFWIGLSNASQDKLMRFLSGARQPHRHS